MFHKLKIIYVLILIKSILVFCAELNPNTQTSFVGVATDVKESRVAKTINNKSNKIKRKLNSDVNEQDSEDSVDVVCKKSKKILRDKILKDLNILLNETEIILESINKILKELNSPRNSKWSNQFINSTIDNLLEENKEFIANSVLALYNYDMKKDFERNLNIVLIKKNELIKCFILYIDYKINEFIKNNELMSGNDTIIISNTNIKDIFKGGNENEVLVFEIDKNLIPTYFLSFVFEEFLNSTDLNLYLRRFYLLTMKNYLNKK
ncbi:hypothetical protein H312_01648 [Anncaliia algerae PRA339]|uniref:SUN domain-containing protein n=1 Tax=Anncaliia algerae PRA339 TaxID=1288291 RepID=A0A059F188_9MICR|nr:hypothetical protein H312_01648 [Anncaliia algerae PRA339]